MLQFSFSGGKDEQVLRLIMQLQGSAEIPLLWKDDLQLAEARPTPLWRSELRSVAGQGTRRPLAYGGRRVGGAGRAGRCLAGDLPATWRSCGPGWRARGGRRRLAAVMPPAQVPLDDAVEAEAMAQLLDHEAAELVDLIKVVYPIHETENLLAQLTVNRQSLAMPGDLRMLAGENEVPPKGYFSLLDRPQPENASGLTADTVPRIVGQVLVYGKQTDREARAELITNRRNLAASRAALEAIAGGCAGRRRVPKRLPAVTGGGEDALALEWYLPEDIAPAERRQLLREGHRQRLLVEWPEMPRRRFGGQTPRQAAADPRLRIPLLAAILNLELASDLLVGFDFNELRGAARAAAGRKDRSGGPVGARAAAGPAGSAGSGPAGGRRLADRLRPGIAGAVHARDHAVGPRTRRPAKPRRRGRQRRGLCHARPTGRRSGAGRQGPGCRPKNCRGRGQIDRPLRPDRIGDSHGPGRYPPGRSAAQTHPHRTLARAGHCPGALLAVGPVGRHSSRRFACRRTSGGRAGLVVPGAAAAEPASKIWTPGSEGAASGGKKPTIWTPGLD